MAEFRGKNQPTVVPLLLLTGHRPPTRQGLLPSLFWWLLQYAGGDGDWGQVRIRADGISEALALVREG